MRERPIMFNGSMVRAILDGRKTQTRRAVKLAEFGPSDTPGYHWHYRNRRGCWNDIRCEGAPVQLCPYGQPGDRLWVRETWATTEQAGDPPDDIRCVYRADDPDWETMEGWRWTPAIHMPRWAARITLEIVSVRVERLQEISHADAQAEGATCADNGVTEAARERGQSTEEAAKWGQALPGWSHAGETHPDRCLTTARGSFGNLWESIYGPGSWDANPWVWAVEFRRLEDAK